MLARTVILFAWILGVFLGIDSVLAQQTAVTYHTFDIEEVYSNMDGTVQFIELREADGLNFQNQFADTYFTTTVNDFIYPTDLLDTATAHRFMLMATASFAALPGAVPPDYIIPEGFFSITGDTLSLLLTSTDSPEDKFTFDPGDLPTDGILSLNRDGSTGVNSPTNFFGETGSVFAGSEQLSIPAVSQWGMVVMILLLVTAGTLVLAHRLRRDRR